MYLCCLLPLRDIYPTVMAQYSLFVLKVPLNPKQTNTVPDTYAESHIADTVSTPGAAAHQAAQHKIAKYSKLASTHMFYPIALETAGTWG